MPMKCFELRMLYSSYIAIRRVEELHRSTIYEILLFSAYLACGVDNFRGIFLALEFNDFAEGVFNSGIITFYKVPINELDS
jgi:hypothetical protein